METYDVIVVGLGPAGSSAAYELARAGHRVLALEKAKMPREKPCGGCLSAKTRTLLGEEIDTLAEEVITNVILTFHGEGEVRMSSSEPIAYMVNRSRFDHYLAQKAQAAGAEVHDGEPIKLISEQNDGYVVHTERDSYRCRFLVGADGVNGVVGRLLGYGPRRSIAVALEGEATVGPRALDTLHGTVRLDVGVIPYGYGWIFPKRDHWSLGVGSVKELGEHPKEYYRVFLEEQDPDAAIVSEKRRGYRIPLFASRRSTLTKGRSLLVGDAAALVDPFLGEGIYYAIRSGQIAAETIHAVIAQDGEELKVYQRRIAEEMYSEFEAAHRVARFGYRFTRVAFALFMAQPSAGEAFLEVLRGTTSYREYWRLLKKDSKLGLLKFLQYLRTPASKVERVYDLRAAEYDAAAFLWRQTAGGPAWNHFEALLRRHLRKGARLLDAGTGTGEALRTVLRTSKPARVVGIDISRSMLRIAKEKFIDRRVDLQQADMLQLPFRDRSFDVVISTWAIETLSDPKQAVKEFLRVIKDDGYVIYAFASLPSFGVSRLYSLMLEKFLGRALMWRFLTKEERPYHDCQRSSLARFANGLTSVVVLRKCCSVDDETTPCQLPESWTVESMSK